MRGTIAIWEIINGKPTPVPDGDGFPRREKDLEKWIVADPSLLGEDLLVLGEQVPAEGAGVIDLLCIGESGQLVIVEFKRDRTTREAIAQALDYGSWLRLASPDAIEGIAGAKLGRPLKEAFDERFGGELPALDPGAHKIILVAPQVDAAAERIIAYLAGAHGVPLKAVFFRYARTNGAEILARWVLLPDEADGRLGGTERPTLAALLELARRRGVAEIVQCCRELAKVLARGADEETAPAYGGSLRYWFGGRMIAGVNIAGQRRPGTKPGQLDVWVPAVRFAEVTGVAEEQVRGVLKASFAAQEVGATDCVLTLSTVEQAKAFVAQIVAWIKSASSAGGVS